MLRKNKTFIEWMLYIKSIHYAKTETIYVANSMGDKNKTITK
tara:strand:+ start:1061 stop:1186 length:126 start_codon:yes stop_codon:yes gene_type:complete